MSIPITKDFHHGLLEIVAALEESTAIYRLYADGDGLASNTRRIELIRRQFLDAYRAAAEPAPRVLVRMGAVHVGRGTTFVNTFDIGSLTEGIAAANGLNVLRIAVMPMAGQITRIQPNGSFATVSYEDSSGGIWSATGVDATLLDEDGWSLIPLAPIRGRFSQQELDSLSNATRFLLLGYDYIVTTGKARGATPLVP